MIFQTEQPSSRSTAVVAFLAAIFLCGSLEAKPPGPSSAIVESVEIGKVPADFPVGFWLATYGKHQIAAFYNQSHDLVVASRLFASDDSKPSPWTYATLPTKVGCDSHNDITFTADSEGCIHLAANMHACPLIYFRTTKPWDITSFERVPAMVGKDETSCTYPKFEQKPGGKLIFHYRSGGSGRGKEIFNAYDTKTRQWSRLLDVPLLDGEGKRSAYMKGPILGSDGWFHLVWVWRDTPDCATNNTVNYARSKDLVSWETITGKPLPLPIRFTQDREVVVDPVPPANGLINGAASVGFDKKKGVVVSYFKFDKDGKTQAYVARFVDGQWVTNPVSQWDYAWKFSGGGSIPFEIVLGSVAPAGPGLLQLPFEHIKYGSGTLMIDETTLKPAPPTPSQGIQSTSAEPERPEGTFPGLEVHWKKDAGTPDPSGIIYYLRWETLPPNRDKQRPAPLPPPSPLRVIGFSPSQGAPYRR